jgi:hypothetical protein
MKKILLVLFALFAVATTSHAQKFLDIYRNGEVVCSVLTASVDSMTIEYDNGFRTLEFYCRGESFYNTLTANVDSIKKRECYVDLGLPSGTLWATCNIGANSPEDYGDYFAWGETEGYYSGKVDFDWNSYKWCYDSGSKLTKYCDFYGYGTVDNKIELELEDDAAYVNWGPKWSMPSYKQFRELINNEYTNTEWTSLNRIYGIKITSKKNYNSIFLPAAGLSSNSSLDYIGTYGRYWSCNLQSGFPDSAYYLQFSLDGVNISTDGRCCGYSVRPVYLPK